MCHRLLIFGYVAIATLMVRAGVVLDSDTDTVPERIDALQRYWPSLDSGLSLWVSAILFIVIVALTGSLSAWVIYLRRKAQKERVIRNLSLRAGLTNKEIDLIRFIASGIKDSEPYEMLISIASFDRNAGAFLKKYCRKNPSASPVIALLSSIRSKLAGIRPIPAAGFPGLGRISMLSRVGVWDVNDLNAKTQVCWVVERQANYLRMTGWDEKLEGVWQRGMALRLKVMVGDYRDSEILASFVQVESKETGLFLVKYDFACAPLENHDKVPRDLNFPSKIARSTGVSEQVILNGLGSDWAQINTEKTCFAGERIELYPEFDPSVKSKGTPAKAVYCCILPEEEYYTVGLRFDDPLGVGRDSTETVKESASKTKAGQKPSKPETRKNTAKSPKSPSPSEGCDSGEGGGESPS